MPTAQSAPIMGSMAMIAAVKDTPDVSPPGKLPIKAPTTIGTTMFRTHGAEASLRTWTVTSTVFPRSSRHRLCWPDVLVQTNLRVCVTRRAIKLVCGFIRIDDRRRHRSMPLTDAVCRIGRRRVRHRPVARPRTWTDDSQSIAKQSR